MPGDEVSVTMGVVSSPSEPGARYVVPAAGSEVCPAGGAAELARVSGGLSAPAGAGFFTGAVFFYLGGVFHWGGIFRWGGVFRIRRGARAIRWEQRGDVPRKAIRPAVPTHPVVSRV